MRVRNFFTIDSNADGQADNVNAGLTQGPVTASVSDAGQFVTRANDTVVDVWMKTVKFPVQTRGFKVWFPKTYAHTNHDGSSPDLHVQLELINDSDVVIATYVFGTPATNWSYSGSVLGTSTYKMHLAVAPAGTTSLRVAFNLHDGGTLQFNDIKIWNDFTATRQLNASGSDVSLISQRLTELGYLDGARSGWGYGVQRGVLTWQHDWSTKYALSTIFPNGVIAQPDWDALFEDDTVVSDGVTYLGDAMTAYVEDED